MLHNVLKLVKHPNLHVILGSRIRVSDAIPNDDWYGSVLWTLLDVENFVNRVAVLPIKSLSMSLETSELEMESRTKSAGTQYFEPLTVTFNCDEKFPFSFLEFLETQRIYCGYKKDFFAKNNDFFTLESAKASFPVEN